MNILAYVPSKTPHVGRQTAHRHAKRIADRVYGKAGFMALKCGGDEGCPYIFQPLPSLPG